MIAGGQVWADARRITGDAYAYIGGQECGTGQSLRLHSGYTFVIEVMSAANRPGCGVPGSQVEIVVNGRPMEQKMIWQPGLQQPVVLFAGPPFARYVGKLLINGNPPPLRLTPYIGNTACGDAWSPIFHRSELTYAVVVEPEELRPGCGRLGVDVTLRLEVDAPSGAFNTIIAEVPWRTGASVETGTVDLSGLVPTSPFTTPQGQ